MTIASAKWTWAAMLVGALLAGCYESTPFPSNHDAASADADSAGDVEDVSETPEDDGSGDTAECPDGLIPCPGGCVDPSTDPANCGGCGNACCWGTTDPGESESGCLDPSVGVYQLCCGGTCVAPSDTGCAACDAPCDGGHCSGMWNSATGTCELTCLSLGRSVGGGCAGAEDCAEVPSANATCLTSAGPISFPGGYCSVENCGGADECGLGAGCVNLIRTRVCLQTCGGDEDCRADEGYSCRFLPVVGGGPYCLPPLGG